MKTDLLERLKAYVDLTRAQFSFAWPLLFVSGLALAFARYGEFSWSLTLRVALIGLFGFEGGMVLNDYVDRELDRKEIESNRLTRYWRLFRTRPLASGSISPDRALALFLLLVALTLILIATLPFPNSLYVAIIMVYSYLAEYFYQVKKRAQRFPLAQLVGRTDFALFPVAGYLCLGAPDLIALLYFLFFYPFAQAHLGVNDLIDLRNDQARGMKTIPILYGINGTVYWIAVFTVFHALAAVLFGTQMGIPAWSGFALGLLLLTYANRSILCHRSPDAALSVLPLFHLTMVIYAGSIILDYAL